MAVDGVNGAQGTIKLNWRLGRVPVIATQPTNQAAIPGTNVGFVCVANFVDPDRTNFPYRFYRLAPLGQ